MDNQLHQTMKIACLVFIVASILGNVGFAKDASILGMKPLDYTTPAVDSKGNPVASRPYIPDTVEYQYSSHVKEGVLRPTVTEGTIIVRDTPDHDLAGLNRDLDNAREITKDKKINVDVYVSPGAIDEILGEFQGLRSNLRGYYELGVEFSRRLEAGTISSEEAEKVFAFIELTDEERAAAQEKVKKLLGSQSIAECFSSIDEMDETEKKHLIAAIVTMRSASRGIDPKIFNNDEMGKIAITLIALSQGTQFAKDCMYAEAKTNELRQKQKDPNLSEGEKNKLQIELDAVQSAMHKKYDFMRTGSLSNEFVTNQVQRKQEWEEKLGSKSFTDKMNSFLVGKKNLNESSVKEIVHMVSDAIGVDWNIQSNNEMSLLAGYNPNNNNISINAAQLIRMPMNKQLETILSVILHEAGHYEQARVRNGENDLGKNAQEKMQSQYDKYIPQPIIGSYFYAAYYYQPLENHSNYMANGAPKIVRNWKVKKR